jgi:hypothetical protein
MKRSAVLPLGVPRRVHQRSRIADGVSVVFLVVIPLVLVIGLVVAGRDQEPGPGLPAPQCAAQRALPNVGCS